MSISGVKTWIRRVRATDYRRECRACATVWVVSRRLARSKPPSGRRRGWALADVHSAGPKSLSNAYMGMLSAEKQRRDSAANAELELLSAAQRCPRCGSRDYTQEKVRAAAG